MTAQISDSFLLQEKKYSLLGVNGTGLFNPLSDNLQPLPRITSCWRGYVCTYKTLDNALLLDTLQINLDHEGPQINNVSPVFSPRNMFDNVYTNIHLHMDFTGDILIGTGFLQQLYVHMGFQPAWKYETVFELSISQGVVLDTKDVSREMAKLREKMIRQPLQPDANVSSQELDDWINSTFKRNYRF